jgi:hypothetical protein
MDSDEREEWEGEPEPEDAAITRRLQELEERQVRQAMARRRPESRRPRNTAWIAFALLLVSIYVFWVLPRQLGSRPVRVRFTQEQK